MVKTRNIPTDTPQFFRGKPLRKERFPSVPRWNAHAHFVLLCTSAQSDTMPLPRSVQVGSHFHFADAVAADAGAETKGGAVALTNARRTAWLQRDAAKPGEKACWRPRKVYRLAALKFIQQLDNLVRVSTSFGGLCRVQFDGTSGLWAPGNWRQWPSLVLAVDQGSDCVSGSNGMLYKLRMNALPFFEFCHGANNDLHGLFKDLKLFELLPTIINHSPNCQQHHLQNITAAPTAPPTTCARAMIPELPLCAPPAPAFLRHPRKKKLKSFTHQRTTSAATPTQRHPSRPRRGPQHHSSATVAGISPCAHQR